MAPLRLDPVGSFIVATCMASVAATATTWLLTDSPGDEVHCDCRCPIASEPATPVVAEPPAPAPPSVPEVPEPSPVVEVRKPSPVAPSQPEVRGALSRDVIRRVVADHIDEVRFCYNQGLASDPALRGRVDIQFTIAPTGSVATAIASSSTLSDRAVERCISAAVGRWTFPKPAGGGNVVVSYPFLLEPG